MKTLRAMLLALSALGAAACARESSPIIAQQLHALEEQAAVGAGKIHRALGDPGLTSPELGEGVHQVEVATRALAALEDDLTASDIQQLLAIVYQARAWDDVATTFASAPPPPGLDATQQAVLSRILDEKALPARVAAATSYARALDRACKTALDQHPIIAEIADGLARYGDTHVSLDRPCAEQ